MVSELLISLATAALLAAEADAAARPDELIFHDKWKPTQRTRNSETQPANAGAQRQSYSSILRSGSAQQDQPTTTLPSHPLPPPPPPPPSAATVPASPPPKRPPQGPQPQLQENAVAKLLEDNDDVFQRLINHPFPQSLGDGSASLDGFRYYMIQDTLYLETCARLKMAAVSRAPDFKDIKNFFPRHTSSLDYVEKSKEILVSMLGVPESIIDTTPRSKNLDASEKYYMSSVRDEDAFFAYYVVLLPCVLSYWRIAKHLMENRPILQNVVYHPAWIEVNYDRSSADKYIKFINANIKAKGGVDRWNHIFRIACMLEADLFNTGLQAPTPYHIIPNGTYSIQSSSAAEGVVLADQNVESSVIGVNKTGGNNEKWHVVVTKDGYTFKNVETGHYLGISALKEGRISQAAVKPYYWWINPVRSQPNDASSLYQIYESRNLRYALHAEVKSVKHAPIIAHENFKRSCQMWSFELDKLEQPNVPDPIMPDPINHVSAVPVQRPTQLDFSTLKNTFAITVPAGWGATITSISRGNCVNLVQVGRVFVNGALEKQEFVSEWDVCNKVMTIDGSDSDSLAFLSSEAAYVLTVEAYHSKNKERKDPRNLPGFKDLSTSLRVVTTSRPNYMTNFPDFQTFTIFDESLDASGQGRTQNAIITVHASIKVTVDLNDPGKPDPGIVNDGYNKELDRPRPDCMDQLLDKYRTVFVVDDSSSMISGGAWKKAKEAVLLFATEAMQYNASGMDVYFLNSLLNHDMITAPEDVVQIFAQIKPQGPSPIGARLDFVLKKIIDQLEKSKTNAAVYGQVRPVNIVVLTNSLPSDDPLKIIQSAAKKLREGLHHPNAVSILFAQLGDDTLVEKALKKSVDESLINMVDTVKLGTKFAPENLQKAVLGATHPSIRAKFASSRKYSYIS